MPTTFVDMAGSTMASRPDVASTTPNGESAIDAIVDAAIEAAPECLRRRIILPSIDWSAVAPQKVGVLLASLAQARVAVPRWLAKSLLVAGHTLPHEMEPRLAASMTVLNRLNSATGEIEERSTIAAALGGLAHDREVDVEIAAALVQRLVGLSWDEEALGFALAQFHRAPHVLRHTGTLFNDRLRQLPAVRFRLAGSSTTHTLGEALIPAFAIEGWRASITEGDFGNILLDLLNPPANVDALLVLLDLEGFATRDWRGPADNSFALLTERADILADALKEFSSRSSVPLLVNSIPMPAAPTAGLLDSRHAMGLRRAIDTLNGRLLEAAERSSRIIVIDADRALSALPARDHVDPKFWYYGRVAYSAEATRHLARAFAEAWRLLRRGSAKVLAVDLDNTLWGGVYGDDGIERLDCGDEFPGNAFRAMQQECLRLRAQGLLLVALSKNNPDAISVFERHPGMTLRPDDFAAAAINWDPKPDNIRKIAAELNLGLDSFLFLDDSPHEREAMRRLCPEVMVPELPRDPAERPSWLRSLAATWPVRLTTEDASRAAMYATESKARSAKAGASSVEDYLTGLDQRLVLSFVRDETVARAAQMHQRTNQFNLTTERLAEPGIAALMKDEARGIAVLGRVTDKFGDHGIVIVATVAFEGREAVIRTLLMSCRVIGREVERAFLGELLRELERRGVSRIHGRYVPTPKNAMVKDFYASCGFKTWNTGNGETVWTFVPGQQEPPASRFVTVSWES